MTSSILKILPLLIILNSIVFIAEAGSSATAITTITAKIVPAASFSVSESILLSRQAAASNRTTISHHPAHAAAPVSGNSVILNTINSENSAKFRVDSSQDMAFNISMSSSVLITDNTKNITANISRRHPDKGQLNINEEHELKIDGVVSSTESRNTGAYHGLIDITVNYN